MLAVCDVGQGDGLVIAVSPGTAVVVDAGPDPPAIDRCLRRLGVRRVPIVLLTHLHADHVEGLPGVLRGRRVGEVATSGYDEPAGELARVRPGEVVERRYGDPRQRSHAANGAPHVTIVPSSLPMRTVIA